MMSMGIERRLAVLIAVAFIALCAVGSVSVLQVQRVAGKSRQLFEAQQLLTRHQHADMMRDALRADVLAAADEGRTALVKLTQHADMGRRHLGENRQFASGRVPASLLSRIVAADQSFDRYALAASEAAEMAVNGSRRGLPTFLRKFYALEIQLGDLSKLLNARAEAADHDASRTASRARWMTLILLVAAIVVFCSLGASTYQRIRRGLQEKADAEAEVRRVSDQHEFENRLHDAFEMTDSALDTFEVVKDVLRAVVPDRPAELLIADHSQAHLRRVIEQPTNHGPNCPVQAPWLCPAVRRGRALVFMSSEDLDACPKLKNRDGGPCSAVCAPVSFMGRALGVLHTTAADGTTAAPELVEKLALLAVETGSQLGLLGAMQKTQLQAATDGLTGLPNRRTLEEHLRSLLDQDTEFAVALGDLDHFKAINDTYGHEAGDRALRRFARILRDAVRPDDLVARYGGEEFVVVLSHTDPEDTGSALRRVQDQLEITLLDGRSPTFTVSFGYASSSDGHTVADILACADEALLAAKRDGRNRVVRYDSEAVTTDPDQDARTDNAFRSPARH